MKKVYLIMIAIISLIIGNISSSLLEKYQFHGIRLSFGWLNNYHNTSSWGFPFTTMQAPPARCFCNIDSNPIATLLNTVIFAILIFMLVIFIAKLFRKA